MSLLSKVKQEINLRILDVIRRTPEFKHLADDFVNSVVSDKAKIYSVCKVYNSSVGSFTYIAQGSIIRYTTIGKFCSIGANFVSGWGIHPVNSLSTSPMFYSTQRQNGFSLSQFDKVEETRPITIGNDVFIGMNVTILDGVCIGDGAIIGAGAVVSKNIPPYAVAVGCPIQIKGYRFNEYIISRLLEIKWWNWEYDKLKQVEMYFDNVEEFVERF